MVGPVIDPTRADFISAVDRFEQMLSGSEAALFFYAGHAVEIGGSNLLLPIDTPSAISERQVRANSIDLREILAAMTQRTRRAIIILDACRDNPLPRDPSRGGRAIVGGTRGLEPIDPPAGPSDAAGSFVMFAAQPRNVALDRLPGDDRDPNGLFTRHLLRILDGVPRPLGVMMADVRDAVAGAARASGREQVPHIDDRMVGSHQFMIFPGSAAPPAILPVPPSGTTGTPQIASLPIIRPPEVRPHAPPPSPEQPPALAGRWSGAYTYRDGRPSVPFMLTLSPSAGRFNGRSNEPNTFGHASAQTLGAVWTASLSGDGRVAFRKTYDGSGGQTHAVDYAGQLSSDGRRISGTWRLNDISGTFTITKSQ